ncbi:hypothetical protein VNO77_22929 [Canavalia gladiata]|uniref:Uncharacterized protein n=1 Tax=Canavalia gladiata TaxID=3824 RepID=A0AAN9QB17_CANGL
MFDELASTLGNPMMFMNRKEKEALGRSSKRFFWSRKKGEKLSHPRRRVLASLSFFGFLLPRRSGSGRLRATFQIRFLPYEIHLRACGSSTWAPDIHFELLGILITRLFSMQANMQSDREKGREELSKPVVTLQENLFDRTRSRHREYISLMESSPWIPRSFYGTGSAAMPFEAMHGSHKSWPTSTMPLESKSFSLSSKLIKRHQDLQAHPTSEMA